MHVNNDYIFDCFYRESRRKTPVIVSIKGKDREFGEAAVSQVIR